MAGCRGSVCCCCRWCCCCGERETRTPEELVSGGGAGEGQSPRDDKRRCRGWGRAEPRRQVAAGGARGTAAWALRASALLRVLESEFFSHPLSLQSEGGSRPAWVNAVRVSFYLHRKGVLNEANIFRMRPFAGLDCRGAGLVSPGFSYPILHSFWVTDDPAFPCKATWENLSCVLRVDTFPLISCSGCCQMKPEFCPH